MSTSQDLQELLEEIVLTMTGGCLSELGLSALKFSASVLSEEFTICMLVLF